MPSPLIFKPISASELRETISDRLSEIGYGKQRFVVERHGKPIAALVTIEDADRLETLLKKALADVAEEAIEEADALTPLEQTGLLETNGAD